jgi:hypothetical protein
LNRAKGPLHLVSHHHLDLFVVLWPEKSQLH